MRDDSESKEKFRRLREQAERFLKGSGSGGVDADAEDFARLLHEIEVHEIELELQNDELQRARRELEAARDECAELFESSPVGYVTLGRNGLIQKANTAAHALLGFKDELTGRPFSSHLEKEDFPTYYEYLNSLVSKPTPSPIEVRVPRPEGVAHVRLEATAEGEKDGTLKRWRLSLVDVTERRRAEEKLRTSRETMLARTEGIARIGSWEWDIATDTVTWSKGLFRIFQRNPSEGAPSWAEHPGIYHHEDMIRLRGAVEKAITDGRPYKLELRALRKDGEVRNVLAWGFPEWNSSGAVVTLHGSVQDITERKEAEKRLMASEHRYRMLIENAQDAVYVIQNGRISFANPSAIRMSGYSLKEILGRGFTEFVHEEDKALIQERYESTLAVDKVPTNDELRIVRKDGGVVWLQINQVVIDWEGRPATLNIARDITAQRVAEEKRWESESRFRALFEGSPVGLYRTDPDGRITEANPALANMLGFSEPEELIGKNSLQFLAHPQDQQAQRRILSRETVLRGYELELRKRDGATVWVRDSARIVPDDQGNMHYEGSLEDVTEQKLVREELKETSAILRAAMDCSTAGIAVADAPDGRLRYVNDAGLGIRGRSKEEVVDGVDIETYVESWQILHLDGTPYSGDEVPLARAVRYGETSDRQIMIRATDQDRIVWAHAAPVRDETGDVIAGIVVFTDITDLKTAEEDRKKLEEQLRQSHKLEAVGTLAGGIAHDFNNILSIIVGNAELAMFDLPEWSPARESLQEIREASLRARDLVTRILLFARKKEHKISSIQPTPIAEECLKMLRASIPTTVEIRQDISEDLPPVQADPSQIQQMIMNLCTNAGQAMEADGGVLAFAMERVVLDEPLDTFSARLPEGTYIRVMVRDNGPGIPANVLARIFDPFFTTKGVGEGTGLGLAVVHGILEDRKGGITFESEEGKGTTFTAYLPASEAEPPGEPPKDDHVLPEGRERILFVDDEPMIARLGRKMLERQGYRVKTLASGVDALNRFKQAPTDFDLVVTDMSMPGMRGGKLAAEILAIRPDVPVILCTGYSKQISEEKAEEIGIRAFVMKPLTRHELTNTVRKVLDEGALHG